MSRIRKRGHIRRRGANSWEVIVDLGRDAQGKRRQRSHSVRGDRDDAQRRLTELLQEVDQETYIEPHKLTVAAFLEQWLTHMEPRVRHKTFWRRGRMTEYHPNCVSTSSHLTLPVLCGYNSLKR